MDSPPRKKRHLWRPPAFESSFDGSPNLDQHGKQSGSIKKNVNYFDSFQSNHATRTPFSTRKRHQADTTPATLTRTTLNIPASAKLGPANFLNDGSGTELGILQQDSLRHGATITSEIGQTTPRQLQPKNITALTSFSSSFGIEVPSSKTKAQNKTSSGTWETTKSTNGATPWRTTLGPPILKHSAGAGSSMSDQAPQSNARPPSRSGAELDSSFFARPPPDVGNLGFLKQIDPLSSVTLSTAVSKLTHPHPSKLSLSVTSHLPQLNDPEPRQKFPISHTGVSLQEKLGSHQPDSAVKDMENPQTSDVIRAEARIPLIERAAKLADSVRSREKGHSAGGGDERCDMTDGLTELTAGLNISPQKVELTSNSREHGSKLVRGGLAEHADRLFRNSSMSFSLWQASLNKLLSSNPSPAQVSKLPKPGLRLRILAISAYTRQPGGPAISASLPLSVLTLCQEILPFHHQNDECQDDREDRYGRSTEGGQELTQLKPQEGLVVFAFANHERISSTKEFEVGKEVWVWRPWHEIDISWSNPGTVAVPSQLAVPEVSGPSTSQDPSGRNVALFCSRFLIM